MPSAVHQSRPACVTRWRPVWLAGAAGFEPLHFGIRSDGIGHRLRLSLAKRRHDNFTRDAHVRLLPPRAESLSEFDSEMQWFESCRPNQPVRSPPPDMERPLKTARFGGILQIWAGLRVRKLATEAPLRLPVSEGGFWCLVFDGASGCCGRREPLNRRREADRLVARSIARQ